MTPISTELSDRIEKEADKYFESNKEKLKPHYNLGYWQGYIICGQIYGARWEQAKKALEEIQQYADSCRKTLNESSADIIYKMADKALATWKGGEV